MIATESPHCCCCLDQSEPHKFRYMIDSIQSMKKTKDKLKALGFTKTKKCGHICGRESVLSSRAGNEVYENKVKPIIREECCGCADTRPFQHSYVCVCPEPEDHIIFTQKGPQNATYRLQQTNRRSCYCRACKMFAIPLLWTPKMHRNFDPYIRKLVKSLLCVYYKSEMRRLPLEVMYIIIQKWIGLFVNKVIALPEFFQTEAEFMEMYRSF